MMHHALSFFWGLAESTRERRERGSRGDRQSR